VIALLGLLFIVAPIAELYVIVKVAGQVGVGNTILGLIVISVLGAWLAKREGLAVLRRLQDTVSQGRVPSAEIVDGTLVLLAGALMLAPGFISDALALLLLVPPTRFLFRTAILRRIRSGSNIVTVISSSGAAWRRRSTHDVWDADSWEDPPGGRHPEIGGR
jgi:UPF0716 protein FxsA